VPDEPLDLPEFARRWATAGLSTSHVALSRAEIEALLLDITTGLVELLRTEPFDPAPAATAGTALVSLNLTGAKALEETLRLLGRDLLGAAGLPDEREWRGRITDVTGALAAGYVDALRERLFDEQEMIKKAVFRARDMAERARRATEARWRAVFHSTAAGIAITDLHGVVQSANPALCALLGREENELYDEELVDHVDPAEATGVREALELVAMGVQEQFVGDVKFIGSDDQPVWTSLSLAMVRDAAEEPEYAVAVVENVSDLHLLRKDQLDVRLKDPLTQLPNRAQFLSTLDTALQTAEPGDRIALCYVDLDGFKIINDGVDHAAGDEVLRRVAGVLKAEFEDAATVARFGGDGFAVLLTGTNGSYPISQQVQGVLDELAEPVYGEDGTGVAVSASVGIVERPVNGLTSADLVRAAEITVHRAKINGKAQWELFDERLDEEYRARYQLGAAIPGALETGEFEITYEPFRRLDNEKLIGFRAALHWNHPKRGVLPPEAFTEMAEETGFIVPMGRWTLERVCEQLGEWQKRFGSVVRPVGLHLTPRLAREQDLIQILQDVLETSGAWADRLRLSMPASVVVDENGEPLENLRTLRDIELGAIIHGYGMGNAGLVDLRTLPVSGVAIAPTVVRAFADAEEGSAFEVGLRQIVGLANQVGVRVLADGVDTVEVRDRLEACGVHYGCGAALGAPMDTQGATALLAELDR
jgi:diguanylate cyclase (GGDEF)-like protein/PAS domain S-box-containing protein